MATNTKAKDCRLKPAMDCGAPADPCSGTAGSWHCPICHEGFQNNLQAVGHEHRDLVWVCPTHGPERSGF